MTAPRYFLVTILFADTSRVYRVYCMASCDAICHAIDLMEAEGLDVQHKHPISIVAKPEVDAMAVESYREFKERRESCAA